MPIRENIPVIAYDFDTRVEVGRYESITKAARGCFIRNGDSSINIYLFGAKGVTFKGKARGVKSKKTGKRYHFEVDRDHSNQST